jgi:hypothetical protein
MQIIKQHRTTKNEAIKKIDSFLNDLMKREFPAGVKIKDPEKKWNGSVMNFSFKAKKGIVGTTISGTISVNDTEVRLDSTLPGIVTTFISEDKVKEVITNQFNELFS